MEKAAGRRNRSSDGERNVYITPLPAGPHRPLWQRPLRVQDLLYRLRLTRRHRRPRDVRLVPEETASDVCFISSVASKVFRMCV